MDNLNLEPGSHIVWIYSGDEGYTSGLVNLIKDSLERNEKILFIGFKDDINRFSEIIKDIEKKDDIYTFTVAERLIFSIKDIVKFLEEKKPYTFRIISVIDVFNEPPDAKYITNLSIEIESICKNSHIWICFYDKNRLNTARFLPLILSHQYLIIDNRIFKNYLYLSPEKILEDDIDYMLNRIEKNLSERDSLWMAYKETSDLSLFENTGAATIVIEDFLIISVNSAFEELTGFKKEEVENKKLVTELIPYREDLERMTSYRELRIKDPGLAPKVYETRIRDKAGRIKDVILNVDVIPGTKRFVCSLTDITEIKRTGRLLRMISLGNQELIKAEDEKDLKDRILKIVKEYGRYRDVFFDQTPEGSTTLRVITDRELTDSENDILKELSQDVDYGIRAIRRRKLLRYNEQRYRTIFKNTPVALMEEDLTEVIEYLDSLRKSGIEDIEGYFRDHPEEIYRCLDAVKILSINDAALRLYMVKDREELEDNFPRIIPESEREKSFKEILALFEGSRGGEFTTVNYTLYGEEKNILLKWFSLPQLPEDKERRHDLIVVLVDITEEKRLSDILRESLDRLRKTFDQTIELISYMGELKDPYTAGHQKNVSELACRIAREMGIAEDIIERIRITGLLHDIGKISVPGEILNKPSKLNSLEFEIVKIHSRAGYDIVKKIDLFSDMAEIILQHHERLDGSGYPRGLKNGEILLEARILAVADVVEAMSSHRPYRAALPEEEIKSELMSNKGKLYDPEVVDAYLATIPLR
ncbi:MAG TPA: HD domain-containing protein [bacterium]|nr:HD domain-containing protein [bacterium]